MAATLKQVAMALVQTIIKDPSLSDYNIEVGYDCGYGSVPIKDPITLGVEDDCFWIHLFSIDDADPTGYDRYFTYEEDTK